MKKIFLAVALFFTLISSAQDDLINSLKNNKSDNPNFTFTIVKELGRTPVKNQGSSGTCWSYATTSFIESEMMRMGKPPVDIAEIFTARNVLLNKAKLYVLNNGGISYGDGGEPHDLLNMFRKYGMVPQEAYSGLTGNRKINSFYFMQKTVKSKLDSLVKHPGKLSDSWIKEVDYVLDTSLGAYPATFLYAGQEYTPQTFAKNVVGINPDDYVELSSYKDYPYYAPFVVPIPDNWSHDKMWNVPMQDLTTIIDYALSKGYTVCWATDVSEPYFSHKNGVAYVPDIDLDKMDANTKKTLFNGPKPEKTITEEMRQIALNNLSTTDDHDMHIVGQAKDQTGKEYYIVKNSWGESNDYKGYVFVTKPYVLYKTTALLIHKKGIPKKIFKKLKP